MDTNENTTPGRASYTEEERRELIEEFQSSNLTQAAFCREWNLNSKTLARWLRIEREDNEMSFCEVALRSEAVWADEVRIRLPNQVEVVVPVTSLENLGRLLREAAGCLA
jgi:transposase-like protein